MLRAGTREYRRNRVLWTLLVAVPAVFIGMAITVTVDTPGPIALVEGARHFTTFLSERRMHAATMVPVTSAFLAGLTGLFVVTGSAGGDRRLVLAGFRPREVLAGRLGVIGAATVLTTAVAVAVSGAWYPPRQWVVFAGANLLIALDLRHGRRAGRTPRRPPRRPLPDPAARLHRRRPRPERHVPQAARPPGVRSCPPAAPRE